MGFPHPLFRIYIIKNILNLFKSCESEIQVILIVFSNLCKNIDYNIYFAITYHISRISYVYVNYLNRILYNIIEMAKEDFFKVYANVPIEERNNVVVVVEEKPISWNLAYQEIKNNTKLAEKILKILKELEII